jgi:hypothetical protein
MSILSGQTKQGFILAGVPHAGHLQGTLFKPTVDATPEGCKHSYPQSDPQKMGVSGLAFFSKTS